MATGIHITKPGAPLAAMGSAPHSSSKTGVPYLPRGSKTTQVTAPGLLSRGASILKTSLKYVGIAAAPLAICACPWAAGYMAAIPGTLLAATSGLSGTLVVALSGAGAAAISAGAAVYGAAATVVSGVLNAGWQTSLACGVYGAATYGLSSYFNGQKLTDQAMKHNAELKKREEMYDARLKELDAKHDAKLDEQTKKYEEFITKLESSTNQDLVKHKEEMKKAFDEKEKTILSENKALKKQQEDQTAQIQTLKEQLEAKDEELTRQSFATVDEKAQPEYPARNNRAVTTTEERKPAWNGGYRGESALYGSHNHCYLNLYTPVYTPVYTHYLNINPWFYTPVFTPVVIPYVWV